MANEKQSTHSKTAAPAAEKPKRQRKPKTVTTPATLIEAPAPERPPQFDLVGEDGRRLARSWSRDSCKELQASVAAQTGEKTKIVPASPFTSTTVEP